VDINLTLSAVTLGLSPHLTRSEPIAGLLVVKNLQAKTYLKITTAQWQLLQLFRESRTVPNALAQALDDRRCPPLAEFFELILKAVRANVLVAPGFEPGSVPAHKWRPTIRPGTVALPLALLFFAGLALSLVLQPLPPTSILDVIGGLVILSAALSFGEFLAGCILRGAGGEVFRPRWRWLSLPPYFKASTRDAIMLPASAQRVITLAGPAVLAAAAGLTVWHWPAGSALPLLGLAFALRPLFGGRFRTVLRFSRKSGLSETERDCIYPANTTPRARLRQLGRMLREPDRWVQIAYGVVWTFALVGLCTRLTGTPARGLAFWKTQALYIAAAVGGALVVVGAGYLLWELFRFVRERARARRDTLRLWRARWFARNKRPLDESRRIKAVAESSLFRALPAAERPQLARAMQTTHRGPWRYLPEYGPDATHVSLIVSGRVGLYRELPSGRTVRIQVLSEGDVIGLHDLADPKRPAYRVRSLSPLTLLTLDRTTFDKIVANRISATRLTDTILKAPFLRQISLCQNWHIQAIERFALLSTLIDYTAGSVISPEGHYHQEFFVIFEQDAVVSRNDRVTATIRPGDFFGEISLLQNSTSTSCVTARHDTRCLAIDRVEFLRFVTHNHSVALDLERVSSKRLGHPIFPLKKGDFRTI
jgi:CRP-like cAMP-binding protein